MDALVNRIFSKLSNHFPRDPSKANADVPEQPLRALRLITRLRTTTVATKSYELFETIMQSTVVEAKKMEAARLALHPSYQQKLDPAVGDPEHIRNFRHYYKTSVLGRGVTLPRSHLPPAPRVTILGRSFRPGPSCPTKKSLIGGTGC
jgi:hypothetical protein